MARKTERLAGEVVRQMMELIGCVIGFLWDPVAVVCDELVSNLFVRLAIEYLPGDVFQDGPRIGQPLGCQEVLKESLMVLVLRLPDQPSKSGKDGGITRKALSMMVLPQVHTRDADCCADGVEKGVDHLPNFAFLALQITSARHPNTCQYEFRSRIFVEIVDGQLADRDGARHVFQNDLCPPDRLGPAKEEQFRPLPSWGRILEEELKARAQERFPVSLARENPAFVQGVDDQGELPLL